MTLEKLVLILVIVVAAAGLTVWVATLVTAAWALPWYGTMTMISLTGLFLYIVGRAIGERLTNRDDDHYDEVDN